MKVTLNALLSLTLFSTALSQTTVADWQAIAIKTYSELGIKNSEFNARFVSLVNERKQSDPDFFKTPDWPMRLAGFVHLELLAQHHERWPKQVVLKTEIEFAGVVIDVGGIKYKGTYKAKAGTLVDLIKIATDGITIQFRASQMIVPPTSVKFR